MEIIDSRRKEIKESNYFNIIENKIVKRNIKYTATENIKLLKTFPNHLKLDDEFFTEIEKIIEKNGNKINARILTNLEISMKKCGHSI
jgi:hypothetical protein